MHLTVFFIPEFDWFLYNDESSNIIKYQMNRNKFLMKRIHLVEKIKESNTIGILIGTLGIKNYLQAIRQNGGVEWGWWWGGGKKLIYLSYSIVNMSI